MKAPTTASRLQHGNHTHLLAIVLFCLWNIHHTMAFILVPNSQVPLTTKMHMSSTVTNNENYWTWRGYDIYTEIRNLPSSKKVKGPDVLLIHGFGCSTTYWRSTAQTLESEGYTVHLLDLLGQGRSAKPSDEYYSINLWAQMVDDYASQRKLGSNGNGVVLMGNSLGSLVALAAATGDFLTDESNATDESFLTGRVKGITMFNCGVGLNSRNILKELESPLQKFFVGLLFDILDTLIFRNRLLLSYVLDNVVTTELLQNTLQNLYIYDPTRVDDALVESFYRPAKDKGAVSALSQIYTNDPGLTPMELHEKYPNLLSPGLSNTEEIKEGKNPLPIHLVWGDEDVVTPLEGSVGQFYLSLAGDSAVTGVTMDIVKGGHVPFDDNPEESNNSMMKWIKSLAPNAAEQTINQKSQLPFWNLGWMIQKS